MRFDGWISYVKITGISWFHARNDVDDAGCKTQGMQMMLKFILND